MKKIREYHIESYWAEEALRREKRAELKEKVIYATGVAVFFALNALVTWGLIDLAFEVI